ncbi:MAG: DUF418 domain-containing protein [Chitinophagaceae bacterium]
MEAEILSPKPVDKAERIASVDVIRGVAILGILLMNIPGFSGEFAMLYEAFTSPKNSADYLTLATIFSFFEGTMRGLFSMLFGAGMLLFILNKKDKPSGATVTEYYFRRLAWLVGFGLLHAYVFQWTGEILFFYGLMGMILFPFRNLSAKWLWGLGLLCIALNFYKVQNGNDEQRMLRVNYTAALAAQQEKKELTEEQQGALEGWPEMEKNFKVDSFQLQENVTKMRGSYGDVFEMLYPRSAGGEVNYTYHGLFDILCMMFIGMALFKMGFLSNRSSSNTYWLMLLLGYGVGIPLGYIYFHGFESLLLSPGRFFDSYTVAPSQLYDIRRVLLCLGHISLLMLIYRGGWLNWLMRALASVGQMAFTNYFMQTVFCTFYFFGYGLGNYQKLSFHQIYYVVAAIWLFQLIISPIWLKYFRFGPFEWLWRSLTYWKKQPMKL